jgi:predicted  nucleic acid-binding Zn-ribbon protein
MKLVMDEELRSLRKEIDEWTKSYFENVNSLKKALSTKDKEVEALNAKMKQIEIDFQ